MYFLCELKEQDLTHFYPQDTKGTLKLYWIMQFYTQTDYLVLGVDGTLVDLLLTKQQFKWTSDHRDALKQVQLPVA
jgi:hypothetical protein